MQDNANTPETLTQTQTTPDEDAVNSLSPDAELELLKERADAMGIKYSNRIGLDALREKINKAVQGNSTTQAEPTEAGEEVLRDNQRKAKRLAKLRKEQLRLVRVRIANLNPQKKDLHGEIFTTGNRILGSVKKYVPYGEATDNGYHIPYIIFEQLKARKFLQIKTTTKNGQINVSTKWVPEFAIEVLDPLTEEELKELAATQAAGRNID